MEIAKEVFRIACLVAAVINGFIAYYCTKHGRYDKAAYWMAFAAFMVSIGR